MFYNLSYKNIHYWSYELSNRNRNKRSKYFNLFDIKVKQFHSHLVFSHVALLDQHASVDREINVMKQFKVC